MYFQLVPIFPDRPDIEMCLEQWPSRQKEKCYFFFGNLLACYVMPMMIIMICYSLIWFKVSARCCVDLELQLIPICPQVSHRDIPGETKDAQKDRIQQQSKIKVVKMLALVVFLFVLSWLPLYSVFSYYKLGECRPKPPNVINILQLKSLPLNFPFRWWGNRDGNGNGEIFNSFYAGRSVAGLGQQQHKSHSVRF